MEVKLTGSEITVKYKEPTENVVDDDGNTTPLTDLALTSIFTVMNGVESKVKDVPATSPTGGGDIEEKFVAEVVGKREVNVEVLVSASDGIPNESPKASVGTVRIDRLPPKSPS